MTIAGKAARVKGAQVYVPWLTTVAPIGNTTAKRAEKRVAEHSRTIEVMQEQQGDARHQTGAFRGEHAALEAAHKSLQEQVEVAVRNNAFPGAARAHGRIQPASVTSGTRRSGLQNGEGESSNVDNSRGASKRRAPWQVRAPSRTAGQDATDAVS